MESAGWFLEAIQQRKQTIQLVMESIIKNQPDYFGSDKRSLKPMVLKDIADDINMDISTVSRVTSGKYVQLPKASDQAIAAIAMDAIGEVK